MAVHIYTGKYAKIHNLRAHRTISMYIPYLMTILYVHKCAK